MGKSAVQVMTAFYSQKPIHFAFPSFLEKKISRIVRTCQENGRKLISENFIFLKIL